MAFWTVEQLLDAGWDRESAIAKVEELMVFERKEAKRKRISRPETRVRLAVETHQRIKEYADAFGISIDTAASKAVEQWMDESGDLNMMFHLEKQKKELPFLVKAQSSV